MPLAKYRTIDGERSRDFMMKGLRGRRDDIT